MKSSILIWVLLWCTMPICMAQWSKVYESHTSTFSKMALQHNQLYLSGSDANITYQDEQAHFHTTSLQAEGISGDIVFLNAQIGFAGSGCFFPHDCLDNALFKTTDGGSTWKLLYDFNVWSGFEYGTIEQIHAFDERNLVIVNQYGFFYTENGGANWKHVTIADDVYQYHDLKFINPQNGFIIVQGYNAEVGTFGAVYHTNDKGKNWTYLYNSIDLGHKINAYDMIDESIHVILTNEGQLLKTLDKGQTWTAIHFSHNANEHGQKISFINTKTGYLYAINNDEESSTLYRTIDGGHTWQEDFKIEGHISNFIFSDPQNGYLLLEENTIYQRKGQSIPTRHEKGLIVTPNPSYHSFRVQTDDVPVNGYQLNVLTIQGQLIHSTHQLHESIYVNDWEEGIYIIEIRSKEGQLLQRGKLVRM